VKGINNRQKMTVRPREHADKRLMTIEKMRKELNRKYRGFGTKSRFPGESTKHSRP
jgi:hypothetical protein